MSVSDDVLIVGSGAAGLTAALNLAETYKVAVIAKGALGEGATILPSLSSGRGGSTGSRRDREAVEGRRQIQAARNVV